MAQYDPVTNTYTLRVPDVVPFNMPESVGGAAVIGDDFGRVVNGNSANNRIELGAGGDLLRGGLGADTLIGGRGQDSYYVDDVGDRITENEDDGDIDTVKASISFTLGANLEWLSLVYKAGNIHGTGNDLDNRIFGNEGTNRLSGGAGADTLNGAGGTDTLVGGGGNDVYETYTPGAIIVEEENGGIDSVTSAVTIDLSAAANVENITLFDLDPIAATGNGTNNTIIGNPGSNTIRGLSGNDRLDGGEGTDRLIGGSGDDVYIVDQAGDVVTENAHEGTDRVISSVTCTLSSHVENLELTGTADIDAAGNGIGNRIVGNGGANELDGANGDDTLTGGSGDDLLKGGAGGTDKAVFSGKRADYTITRNTDGSFTILDNRTGGDGRDTLSEIEIFEFSDSSAPTVADPVVPTVADPVVPTGPGIALPQNLKLIGTKKRDKLVGADGNDHLVGKLGLDVLSGGGGNDVFKFDTKLSKANMDRITDFSVKDDTIWLDNDIFNTLGKKGSEAVPSKLDKKFFRIADKAKDKNDTLVYNKKTGLLSYDADGSGKDKAVEIAALSKGLKLTTADFFIV